MQLVWFPGTWKIWAMKKQYWTRLHFKTLKDYDIIAIQEVVSGDGGAQTIAKLHYKLNQTGSKWDYAISDPTSSSAYKSERYAFFWKTSKVSRVGNSWLEKNITWNWPGTIFTTFKAEGKVFTLVNYHAITKAMQPETEVKYFRYLPEEYPNLNLIFVEILICRNRIQFLTPWNHRDTNRYW